MSEEMDFMHPEEQKQKSKRNVLISQSAKGSGSSMLEMDIDVHQLCESDKLPTSLSSLRTIIEEDSFVEMTIKIYDMKYHIVSVSPVADQRIATVEFVATIPESLYDDVYNSLLQLGEEGKDWWIHQQAGSPIPRYYVKTLLPETAKEIFWKHQVLWVAVD